MLDVLRQDLKFAVRSLWRSRGFAAAAALSVALGIGANSIVFSAVSAVLFRPLSVERPERLVTIATSDFSGPAFGASSFPDFRDFAAEPVFAGVFAYRPAVPLAVRGDTVAERRTVSVVTGNYFEVLGVRPALGRLLMPADDRDGAEPAAVLSHGLWQRQFGGRPTVVGETVTLTGARAVTFTVVGIAPASFAGVTVGVTPDFWIPWSAGRTAMGMPDTLLTARGSRGLLLMGRLRDGVSAEEAAAAMGVVAARLQAAFPDAWTDVRGQRRRITVLPEVVGRLRDTRPILVNVSALLLGVVGVVLLVACANLANLLLARASKRRVEVGVRLALGAPARTIVRQHLIESSLVAAAGGTLGLLTCWWLLASIERAAATLPTVPWRELTIDTRVLAFTAGVTLLTGLISGLAPALRASRLDVIEAFRGAGTPTTTRRWGRVRGGLVVVQLASSMALLVLGGQFFRGLVDAQRIDLGFGGANVAMFTLQLPAGGPPAASTALRQRLLDAVRSQPGVERATFSRFVPLGADAARTVFVIDGYTPAPGEDMELFYNNVGPDYFATLDVPVLQGRPLTTGDFRTDTPAAALVNESFSRRYLGGRNPVGARIHVGAVDRPATEIVGVVRDGKYRSIGEQPTPYVFLPYAQGVGLTLYVRTSGDPAAVVPAMRRLIAAADRDIALVDTQTMESHLARVHAPIRLGTALLGVFAALAMTLAAIGLYSVTAYALAQRTREIGIRMALGATRALIVRLVVADCAWMIASGIAIGLAIAIAASRLVETILVGSERTPAGVAGISALVLLAAAAAAVSVTLRRATHVNPLDALRTE
jgi:predicted permease